MRLRRLAGDERGFTLVEVLVAASVGSIVMLAALGLADATLRATTRTSARADSGMRGREGLEQMIQVLRSSVCIKQATTLLPIDSGTPTSVTFYADVAHPSGTGTDDFVPQKWQLSYANGTVTEKKWTGTGTYGDPTTPLDFSGATPTTRTVLVKVRPQPGIPIFSYYAYSGSTAPDPYAGTAALTASPQLSATDLAKVAMVRISFTVGPLTKGVTDANSDTTFDEVVRLRQVDPANNPAGGAACMV